MSDLANRGLLPKFRPATLGGQGASRPVIRPVRPTAPPPPPTPPRRRPAAIEQDDEPEYETSAFGEPPTMAAARERLHAIARDLPRDHAPRFEDETRGRIDAVARYPGQYDEPEYAEEEDDDGYETGEPETSLRNEYPARQYADYEQPEPYPASDRYASGGYDQQDYHPRGQVDSGPRERPEPVAYDHEAYETSYPGVKRPPESYYPQDRQSYRAPSYDEPVDSRDDSGHRRRDDREEDRRESYRAPQAIPQPTRREESSARHQEEAPSEPPPAQTEMKVPANFVVGVQPLRQPVAIAPAFPAPADASPMTQPPAAGTMAASPRAMQAGQQQPMIQQTVAHGQLAQNPQAALLAAAMIAQAQAQGIIPPGAMNGMAPGGMGATPGPRMPTSRPTTPPAVVQPRPATTPPQPVGHQLQTTEVEEAAQGSKVGRFAWFVFGAAFGIFFAFFATGFVPRLGKKEEIVFPPVAQATATTTAAATTATAPSATTTAYNPAPFVTVPAPTTTVAAVPSYAPTAAPTMTTTAPAYAPTAAPPAPTVTAYAYPTAAPTPAPTMTMAPAYAPAPTYAPVAAQPQPQPTAVVRYTPAPARRAPTPAPRRAARSSDDAPAKNGSSDDLLSAGLGN